MGRAPCCEKVGLKKGRWTAEEDETLRKYILENGEGNWRSLPKNAGLLRCGKSCRLRWINYLRNDLKRGNISSGEQEVIINLHSSLGNRWSLIASQLPGRTDNEIKNYWNSHLSRKIHSYRRPAANTQLATAELAQTAAVPKRKGGRRARWAMKKNRSNFTVHNHLNGVSSVNKTKENVAINEAVPLPSSPDLDKEVLSTTTVEEDWMVLEPITFHAVEKIRDTISGPHNSELFCSYDVLENKLSEPNEVVQGEIVKSKILSSRLISEGCEVDWESVVREDVWDQNQSMLSWLLDDENNVDRDSQYDIVSWLLS